MLCGNKEPGWRNKLQGQTSHSGNTHRCQQNHPGVLCFSQGICRVRRPKQLSLHFQRIHCPRRKTENLIGCASGAPQRLSAQKHKDNLGSRGLHGPRHQAHAECHRAALKALQSRDHDEQAHFLRLWLSRRPLLALRHSRRIPAKHLPQRAHRLSVPGFGLADRAPKVPDLWPHGILHLCHSLQHNDPHLPLCLHGARQGRSSHPHDSRREHAQQKGRRIDLKVRPAHIESQRGAWAGAVHLLGQDRNPHVQHDGVPQVLREWADIRLRGHRDCSRCSKTGGQAAPARPAGHPQGSQAGRAQL
eukprot:comp22295_c0_seq1/m.53330 comp22295_c0_seq1/g.53330  ORF comp22295_c0_seq1/g.53330 comp22295_c0_seq1/m.53330 type:complete len:303 (-) comp22295_c0_seq1:2337-3245(-)